MRQSSSAIGFLALCAVLVTAIWIPNTDSSISALPDPDASSSQPGNRSVLGDQLSEEKTEYRQIPVRKANELAQLFDHLNYFWPIDRQATVPAIEITALPLDLGKLETRKKKAVFLRTLLPLILSEQSRVRFQRKQINDWIQSQRTPNPTVQELARLYRIDGDLTDKQNQEQLLRRVDIIPAGLALAQAANESGWGTSRFAVNANNLFGVWTYKRYAGLAPRAADATSRHSVRVYPSLRRAVRSYFFNINVGHAYRDLRKLREQMRHSGEPLDALKLAEGLVNYSSRGEEYVKEIRQMIRTNKLDQLGELTVASIESLLAQ